MVKVSLMPFRFTLMGIIDVDLHHIPTVLYNPYLIQVNVFFIEGLVYNYS